VATPEMAKNSIKNYFLVVLDNYSLKKGPIDLVKGFFFKLGHWAIHLAFLLAFEYLF
jgi:hypothetical protein